MPPSRCRLNRKARLSLNMLQYLPNSTSPNWSPILGEDIYLRNTGPKQQNAASNPMVKKAKGFRGLFLRKEQRGVSAQSLHNLPYQATPENAIQANEGLAMGTQCPITGNREELLPNEIPYFVTSKHSASNSTLDNLTILPGTLSPSLRDRLMGKSPLRLITERTPHSVRNSSSKYYTEKLECGHGYTAYQSFYWDEGGHLIRLEPTEKRRRCQECREIQQLAKFLPPKKPAASVRPANTDKKISGGNL
jgi:hypothetical protein